MAGVLAIRFDVDSVTCLERGIPPLRQLARRLGVRFTFFVNMGYSFNWSHNARHLLGRRHRGLGEGRSVEPRSSLPTSKKLGWAGMVKTVLVNPRLGDHYKSTFDVLHAEGHELGLHGGTDHVVWQRSLENLSRDALDRLFRPAFEKFSDRYGRPAGFASPGFRYNGAVLDLLDREGFVYASDMSGETPFRPDGRAGKRHAHFQVPVNVLGRGNVPLIEEGLARGRSHARIVDDVVAGVEARDFALLYGHPYVEGVNASLLGDVLRRVMPNYEVVPVVDYLARWRARHG
jgi:peptidoglycan/xylan/chitin deacetylase (PgdA/CDA1 family)